MIRTRRLNPQTKDLQGSSFGLWTVQSFAGYAKSGRSSNATWNCICHCGANRIILACNLLSGKSKACITCANSSSVYVEGSRVRNIAIPVSGMPVAKWTAILKSARIRNIDVSVTPEHAYELFVSQEGRCILSGMELTLKTTGTASLDRIDSLAPYVVGNIQWVHKHVNRMKNIYGQDYFIEVCKKIAYKAKK